jgi:raffinose/stachyose/melibiose transport system permease protein
VTSPAPAVRRAATSVSRGFGYVLLASWALLGLLPFAVMILGSVKTTAMIYADPFGLPGVPRFANFLTAWMGPAGGEPLGRYFLNSALVAVMSLGLGVGSGTLAAYGLARSPRRWTTVLHGSFVVLLTVPIAVTLVPLFVLSGTLGLRNSIVGLALVYSAYLVPTTAILMRSYFAGFPTDLLDAARIDGCSELRSLWHVVLPLANGALISVTIVGFLWVWSELFYAVALVNAPGSKTLPVGLLLFQGQYFTDRGAQFAGLLMATLPVVALYAVFQRRITQGFALGGYR